MSVQEARSYKLAFVFKWELRGEGTLSFLTSLVMRAVFDNSFLGPGGVAGKFLRESNV